MTSGTGDSRSTSLYPWIITAGSALIAAGLIFTETWQSRGYFGNWWLLALLFVGFLVGEAITLRLHVGRQDIVASLVEVPLIFSLFLLGPLGVLATRVVAAGVVQAWRTRGFTKFCFNIALCTASTAVANAVVEPFAPLSVAMPRTWVVALAAILAANVVTYMAVSAVISLVQGGMSVHNLARNAQPMIANLVCAVIALVLLLAVQVTVWSIALLLVLATVVAFGYRAYARFLDQHQNLGRMYELTRAVRRAGTEGELADILLARVRSMAKAEFATLWLPESGRYPELLLTAKEGVRGLLDQSPVRKSLRNQVLARGATIAVGPKLGDEQLRASLKGSSIKDAIIVPLRSGSATVGCLECVNRLGDLNFFDAADVTLLEAVASQTAVAVENTRLVDRLRFDAYHDALTSLPNRHRMISALDEAVQVRAPGEVVALLIFDVDGMRDVNDSLGHGAGDQLLAEVGKRLAAGAPAGSLVSRIGGDEFALLLRIGDQEAAVALAGELRATLQDPMPFDKLWLDVDTAVGIAIHPDHGSDPEVLLQRADLATQSAKGTQSAVQVFNLGLESRSVRRLGLAGDLRRAIDNGDMEVYFQPKIAIGRRELVGVECLARWKHPTHGWVAPEDFVAVAEHTGQLGRLTDLVLREGLRRCHQWDEEGHPLTVAVNLAPRTLVDPLFPGYLEELIAEYGVPPERLTLEITEGGMTAGADRPLPTLRRLRGIGVRLSVDDFGTGGSSLSYLRRLPVHEVKIDRTFVQGMATDPGDYAIVRAVVDLSRHFGLEVVAEGVESELALSQLEEIGCDVGQGFFFSRPLSYERLAAWLIARTELMPAATGVDHRLRVVP